MKGIVGQTQPVFNMDDVHRRTLDESLEHFGLQAFSSVERDQPWRTWHARSTPGQTSPLPWPPCERHFRWSR